MCLCVCVCPLQVGPEAIAGASANPLKLGPNAPKRNPTPLNAQHGPNQAA